MELIYTLVQLAVLLGMALAYIFGDDDDFNDPDDGLYSPVANFF